MRAYPLTLKQANAIIDVVHRHCNAVQGCKFAIGVSSTYTLDPSEVVGAAICGRPSAKSLDCCRILQVSRVAVPSSLKNGCSFLLGRCARVARALGYRYLITYTRDGEDGSSLLASGFYRNHYGYTKTGDMRLRWARLLWSAKEERQHECL